MTITVIIIISILLLLAYLFDLTSARTRIPSVILLLFLGWGGRVIADFFSFQIPDLTPLLPIFGTLGLILIVLEGALELDFNKSKLKLIRTTMLGAIGSILALCFFISYVFQFITGASFHESFINALPISVISSSVAISSARNLNRENKEFVIYESSLSDIIGVVLFNFILANSDITFHSFTHFGLQILIICAISLLATLLLAGLLSKIDHPIKHAPIIILLILIYAVSEIFHLPALIFVLFFGLFLSNIDEIKETRFTKWLKPYEFEKEIHKFKDIVTEGAFLVRSFFFLLFGYSFETREIINPDTFGLAVICFLSIFIVRGLILTIQRQKVLSLLFIAPRGLITILLFFSVPMAQAIPIVNKSLIVQIIILTTVFMMIGLLITTGKGPAKDKKESMETEAVPEYTEPE